MALTHAMNTPSMNTTTLLGNGPIRVIALHGWFGSSQSWGPLADVLDRERFTYAFIDYRGYGRRMGERGDYTIDEIARDTLQAADRLGWAHFDLIGHSMGGSAIQRVLVDAPGRVGKLVAIAPVPASGVPFDEPTWSLFSRAADEIAVRQAIIDNSTGQRLSRHWSAAMAASSAEHSTREAFAAYLKSWAKTDFSAEVIGNPAPVKVLVGEHDPGLTAEVMRATYLRWYPNASLETIANAGHYPMDETPVALATAIERFLAPTT
jgi:pimeloyl-ACP methyl ester carboxylesterase